MKQPILIVGDSPAGHSGLGRILRDLAVRIHENMGDVLDVATLGLGAPPTKSLPFMQYQASNVKDWVLEDLPYAWKDHAGDADGIIFCIWDISRLLWFAYPEQCQSVMLQQLRKTLKAKTWIYPAIDGSGPNGKMPSVLGDALTKFDRVLNYTQFSAKITGYPDVCTHGIDTGVFYPRSEARAQVAAKWNVNLDPGEAMIGIVATNQPRKRWDMAFSALRKLKETKRKIRVWLHVDTDMRYWDLKSLYVDFGLDPNIKVFLTPYGISDDDMATLYSAMDMTLGIGVEGWGYPLGESLACGTPCVTGSYGGQSDFVPREFMVDPVIFQHEGIFAIQRPVYDSDDWAAKINETFGKRAECPDAIKWENAWKGWENWLRKGL